MIKRAIPSQPWIPDGAFARGTRVLFVAALVTTCLNAVAKDKPPDPKGTWIEARSASFTFTSNASEKEARSVAQELEVFREVLARSILRARLASPTPTYILVFDGDRSFAPYRNNANVRGYFLARTDASFAAFVARPPLTPHEKARSHDEAHFYYSTVFHEYAHHFFNNNFANLPPWLREGLAQYFETFRMDEGDAQVGYPRQEQLRLLAEVNWIPLKLLLGSGRPSREASELTTAMFYAESWLVVHYSLNGNRTRRPQLERYLDLLEQGIPVEDAFGKAFETSFDALAAGQQQRALAILREVMSRNPGLLLDYLRVPADWKWSPWIGAPPARPQEIAPLVRDSLGGVSDADLRSKLQEWASSVAVGDAAPPSAARGDEESRQHPR